MDSTYLYGSCHCSSIRIKVDVSAVRFGFASCHCNACRLTQGSPFILWTGLHGEMSDRFIVNDKLTDSEEVQSLIQGYRSSPQCTRYFCKMCGCTTFINYSDTSSRWNDEIHFPTAILNEESVHILEKIIEDLGKPRYLHVFVSDKSSCLGDFNSWANAPKYGGETGLEPL